MTARVSPAVTGDHVACDGQSAAAGQSADAGHEPCVDHETQRILAYQFRRPDLLEEALTHRSHLQGNTADGKDNERLEFLGDAVLGLVVSEYLSDTLTEATEGDLSNFRARLVGRDVLTDAARRLDLGRLLRLGRGEERTAGREKSSLLANALEAVIAAIYVDGGLAEARAFVLRVLEPRLQELREAHPAVFRQDYKSQLQEWSQQRFHALPVYTVVDESGPDHRKAFAVTVTIAQTVYGSGMGGSKKIAEQHAAQQALATLAPADVGDVG